MPELAAEKHKQPMAKLFGNQYGICTTLRTDSAELRHYEVRQLFNRMPCQSESKKSENSGTGEAIGAK